MGEALAQKADVVITQGATQSNHARQTAAAAAASSALRARSCSRTAPARPQPDYRLSGNVLLDRLFGATLHHVPGGTRHGRRDGGAGRRIARARSAAVRDPRRRLESRRRARLRDRRRSNWSSRPTWPGSTSTSGDRDRQHRHAGRTPRRARRLPQRHPGARHLRALARRQRRRTRSSRWRNARPSCSGSGRRGSASAWSRTPTTSVAATACRPTACIEALELVARTEGIVLDPVYSGKAMAGLIDLVRRGQFARDAEHRLPAHRRRGRPVRLRARLRAAARTGLMLGVIGGMGPLATADFFRKLIDCDTGGARRGSRAGADPFGAAVAVAAGGDPARRCSRRCRQLLHGARPTARGRRDDARDAVQHRAPLVRRARSRHRSPVPAHRRCGRRRTAARRRRVSASSRPRRRWPARIYARPARRAAIEWIMPSNDELRSNARFSPASTPSNATPRPTAAV